MQSYLVDFGRDDLLRKRSRNRRRREKAEASLGAVAQLEERLICIQQVIGSNPFGSTRLEGS